MPFAEVARHSAFHGYELQIAGRTWFFRGSIVAIPQLCRKNKLASQMRYVFKEQDFLSQGNVIEQYQVLMQLSHITHVRYHGQAELPSQ